MKYIIEHMEEEFSDWVKLEYAQIARDIGGSNLILTSVSEETQKLVPAEFTQLGIHITNVNVTEFGQLDSQFAKEKVILLDPAASQELTPEDFQAYDYFLFGGILGDHPPRDRTGELRKLGFVGRHLGKTQMTTDTAVRVVDLVSKGQKLSEVEYIDFPELKFSKHESTEMPFRYVKGGDGKPILPEVSFENRHLMALFVY
jgi:ribosome biogenesis SPOUT family RNA methylase Rps3